MRIPGLKTTLMIYTFLLIIDVITTVSLGELTQYLEANPIYQYLGVTGIIAANLVMLGIVYWSYNKFLEPGRRFLFINTLVILCLLRIIAIINNIKILQNPPTLQEAMAVTPEIKVAAIISIGSLAVLPFLSAFISYWLFKMDHTIKVKKWNG